MKSLNSFTDLPISKGLLLLVDTNVKEELEALMLGYIEAEKNKKIAIVPLMRYLYEKMNLKGDDLKIAFCATCADKNENYFLDKTYNTYQTKAQSCSVVEKKLIPLFEDYYRAYLVYTSKEEIKEKLAKTKKMFTEDI